MSRTWRKLQRRAGRARARARCCCGSNERRRVAASTHKFMPCSVTLMPVRKILPMPAHVNRRTVSGQALSALSLTDSTTYSMIEVHHLNESRSRRITWLLEEIGLDYTLVQ